MSTDLASSSALLARDDPRVARSVFVTGTESGPAHSVPAAKCGPWLTLLCLTLLGYALLGKGGAYIGVPPVFIGEVVLVCGLVSFLLYGNWRGIVEVPAAWSLMLLVVWALFRILPDLPIH